ncbi:MAG: rhodanese-like domain-containing protein [Steroidobacteraceae bacterium]
MTRPEIRSSWTYLATRCTALVLATVGVIAHSATANASGSATGQPPGAQQLPADKQTTLGLYLTAREAYEKWKAAPDKVTVLDVRTPEEYLYIGHAEMAWNIPLASQSFQWDSAKKQFPMVPLPDFVARVRTIAKPDDTLLVMCRSGGRSAMAVNALAKAGFSNVYNITDGFEGDAVKNPDSVFNGQRLVNGWRNSGLPWTYQIDPSRMVLQEPR